MLIQDAKGLVKIEDMAQPADLMMRKLDDLLSEVGRIIELVPW